MKNQTPDQQQRNQQKNWNTSKSESELNDKNFSSRNSGLEDDSSRDMDLSDDDDVEDMDVSSKDESTEGSTQMPERKQTESTRNAGGNSQRSGSQPTERDSNRESTSGASRSEGQKGKRT